MKDFFKDVGVKKGTVGKKFVERFLLMEGDHYSS